MKKSPDLSLHHQWFLSVEDSYKGLPETVANTLIKLLKHHKIDFLSINHRVKTLDSFIKKSEIKNYSDPKTETTDIAGIRVITYIEEDVRKVMNIIKKTFYCHQNLSVDKSEELGSDKFGYRSVHFICELGEDRHNLPELTRYKNLLFEIQVRTVLQHAWAEIEHDRSYKFSGVLPRDQHRRLNLIAGLLELADREFNSIANDLDSYAKEVSRETDRGNLDFEINTTSLYNYLPKKLQGYPALFSKELSRSIAATIAELHSFGISTLNDLEVLLSGDYLNKIVEYPESNTVAGFLRKAMMYKNLEKYFSECWDEHFSALSTTTYDFLKSKYSTEEINGILKKYGVEYSPRKFIVKRRETARRKST